MIFKSARYFEMWIISSGGLQQTDQDVSGPLRRARNRFYDHVRDLLLLGYLWRFAGKRVSCANLSVMPIPPMPIISYQPWETFFRGKVSKGSFCGIWE